MSHTRFSIENYFNIVPSNEIFVYKVKHGVEGLASRFASPARIIVVRRWLSHESQSGSFLFPNREWILLEIEASNLIIYAKAFRAYFCFRPQIQLTLIRRKSANHFSNIFHSIMFHQFYIFYNFLSKGFYKVSFRLVHRTPLKSNIPVFFCLAYKKGRQITLLRTL